MKEAIAVILAFLGTVIVVAVLAALAFFYDYEHTKGRCGNCKFYDKTLRTCWPKFEERFDGDKGCAFFENREYEK